MQVPFVLSPPRVTKFLFVILALLFLGHLLVTVGHFQLGRPLAALTRLFDMDLEANLPATFNMLLLIGIALLLFLLARIMQDDQRRTMRVLAYVFVFLAVDEGAQVHERLMLVTLRLLNNGGLGDGTMGWLYYAWIIPYGLAAAALLVWLIPWLRRLEPRLRNGFLLSGAIYMAGALGLESAAGRVAEAMEPTARSADELDWLPCVVYDAGQCYLYADGIYVLLYTLEELAEMSGLILMIRVLLLGLRKRHAELSVRFSEG